MEGSAILSKTYTSNPTNIRFLGIPLTSEMIMEFISFGLDHIDEQVRFVRLFCDSIKWPTFPPNFKDSQQRRNNSVFDIEEQECDECALDEHIRDSSAYITVTVVLCIKEVNIG